MVIERDLIKLCKDIITLLIRLEEDGLITKDELKEHLEKKLQFLQFTSDDDLTNSDKRNKTLIM